MFYFCQASRQKGLNMKVNNGRELMAEIKKYMYVNGYNLNTIAEQRDITKQAAGAFFRTENPRFNSIIETLNAIDADFYIEIKKKEN